MVVILDANIWISEKLLKSSMGAALLYAIRQNDGKIILPDVIEKEAAVGLQRFGIDAVEKIQQGFATIQALVGKRPEYKLPSRADFEKSARRHLEDIERFLERFAITFDHHQSALQRVIEKRSPSATKEQYRDSLLWEVVLEYARSGDVYFITNDGDFYQDRKNKSKGIANDLKEEISELPGTVKVFSNLQQLLQAIEGHVDKPDAEVLAAAIDKAMREQVESHAARMDFSIGQIADHRIDAFLTESARFLALSFELEYEAFDIPSQDDEIIEEGRLRIRGDCLFDLDKETASDIRLARKEGFTLEGEKIYRSDVLSVGLATLGVKMIPYELRRRI